MYLFVVFLKSQKKPKCFACTYSVVFFCDNVLCCVDCIFQDTSKYLLLQIFSEKPGGSFDFFLRQEKMLFGFESKC